MEETAQRQEHAPFVIELKITSLTGLITNCLKQERITVCKNMKDAHMNTIKDKYILISINKNAHVINRATGQLIAELNLKSREMSSSCVTGNYLYIGTYVDTLFVFSLQ